MQLPYQLPDRLAEVNQFVHYDFQKRWTIQTMACLLYTSIPEERAFPMPDAAHVRAAEAYFRYASDDQKPELARNILEKAAEYGVRVESPVVLSWACLLYTSRCV